MAFSQVGTDQVFTFADGNTPGHSCAFGSAPSAGDWDILLVASDTTVNTPTGFTSLASRVVNMGAYIFGRKAAGGESGTVSVVTNGNNNTVVIWQRWSGGNSADVVATAGADASSGNATPTATTAALAGTGELAVVLGALSNLGGGAQTSPTWSNSFTAGTTGIQGLAGPGVRAYSASKTGVGTAAVATAVTWSGDAANNRYTLIATFTAAAGGGSTDGTIGTTGDATTASLTGTSNDDGTIGTTGDATTASFTGTSNDDGTISTTGNATTASFTATANTDATIGTTGDATTASFTSTANDDATISAAGNATTASFSTGSGIDGAIDAPSGVTAASLTATSNNDATIGATGDATTASFTGTVPIDATISAAGTASAASFTGTGPVAAAKSTRISRRLAALWFVESIGVERYLGDGAHSPFFDSSTIAFGAIDHGSKEVLTPTGDTAISTARVFLPIETDAIPLGSRVTLPDGHGGGAFIVIAAAMHISAQPTPNHVELSLQ